MAASVVADAAHAAEGDVVRSGRLSSFSSVELDAPVDMNYTTAAGGARYEMRGSAALADSVAPFCHTHSALLLEHHGLVTWGRSLEQAYFFLESAEALARVMLYTRQLGVSHRLTESQIDSLIALRPSWGLDAGRGGRPKGRPDA